jgi:hypothetical protein
MKHAVHQRFVIGCVLAVVGGVVVWTMFVCNTFACIPADTERPGRGGDNLSGHGSDQTELANQSSFEITGSPTKPMSPGVHVPLDLRLQNSNETSMSVHDLVVTVRRVDAPRETDRLSCLVQDFTVEQAPDGIDLTVPPQTTTSLSGLSLPRAQWPHVALSNTSVNQDGCKGASLTLEFSASGKVDE